MFLVQVEKMIDTGFALMPRFKPSVELAQCARLIAHRGAHDNQGIMENTLAAFRLAQQSGCWGLELDVHATADKILVVNHDPTLQRLWGHNLSIADMHFADLRALAPEVPTLDEVVTEFGRRMHLFIELKSPFDDEEVLVRTLQGLTARKDYHLLALDAAIFPALVSFPKYALLLVAVHNNVREFSHLSVKNQYGGVLGHYLLLTNNIVNRLGAAKQVAGVGFVDSKYSLYRELNRGVSLIFTNNAVAVSSYLKSLL